VRCDSSAPNPFTQQIRAVPGTSNVTVDVLSGAILLSTPSRNIEIPGSSLVTNAGSLTLAGNGSTAEAAVTAFGSNNTVINSGSISTSERFTYGIAHGANSTHDTFVNTGSITTSGDISAGMVLFGTQDSATNSNGGIITTSGFSSAGLFASGSSNSLTNAAGGTITTSNTNADGMYFLGGGNRALNSGTIELSGDNSSGLRGADGGNTITNEGAIRVRTVGATGTFGILSLGGTSTVTNTGTITNTSFAGLGMDVGGDTNVVSNSGSISTAGSLAPGIRVGNGTGNRIANSGTVTTSGAASPGVSLTTSGGQTSSFINSAGGTVTSQQSEAVLGGFGNERVENHGVLRTIVAGGTAVDLAAGDDTFIIGPTSSITGIVTGSTGTNTFSLGGSGTGTFDLGQFGPTGQFRDFQALTMEDASTWTLTGATAFNGPTTVNAGTLLVNGSLAGSVVTVRSGATLGGNGTIGGLVATSNSIVSPGNSIGQLNVSGNVSFAAGSTYAVEVNAAGAGDRIAATGTASLAGGTVQALASAGNYAPSTRYNILTASGGLTGQFAGVTSNLAFLTPSLSYDANNAFLTLAIAMQDSGSGQPLRFSSVALTRNQVATADGTQSLGLGNPVYNAVLSRTASEARQAFDALSGEVHSSVITTQFETLNLGQRQILSRLQLGFDPGAVLPGFPAGTTLPAAFSADLPSGRRPELAPVSVRTLDPRVFSMWGSGFGSFGSTSSNGNAGALTRDVGGFVIGADATFDQMYRIGIAGGFARSSFDVPSRASSGETDTGFGAIYGGASFGPVTLRLGGLFAGMSSDTRRSIVFPGFADNVSARFGGTGLLGFGEVGYRFDVGSAGVEPFVGGSGMRLSRDGYTERGGPAALTVLQRDYDIQTFTAGVRASTPLWFDDAFTVRGQLAYRRAFGDVVPTALLAFAGGGTQFQTAGIPIDVNALVAEAGVGWQATKDIALELAYTGQVGQRAEDHGAKGSFLWKF
jgi:fibronectin-binding autotransporter adhesin